MTVSPESPFDLKFFKVDSVIVYSFIKNFPNLQGPPLPLPHLRAKPIKGVYVINYSWYVQQYDPVCITNAWSYKTFDFYFCIKCFIKSFSSKKFLSISHLGWRRALCNTHKLVYSINFWNYNSISALLPMPTGGFPIELETK